MFPHYPHLPLARIRRWPPCRRRHHWTQNMVPQFQDLVLELEYFHQGRLHPSTVVQIIMGKPKHPRPILLLRRPTSTRRCHWWIFSMLIRTPFHPLGMGRPIQLEALTRFHLYHHLHSILAIAVAVQYLRATLQPYRLLNPHISLLRVARAPQEGLK